VDVKLILAVASYLETAEWADKPEGVNSKEFSVDAFEEVKSVCAKFLKDAKALPSFDQSIYDNLCGGDIWLSRNGHGAGFFCRGDHPYYGELQELAKKLGYRSLFANYEDKWEFDLG